MARFNPARFCKNCDHMQRCEDINECYDRNVPLRDVEQPPSPAAPEWTEPCAVCPDGNTCFNAEMCLRASRQANQPPSPAAPAERKLGKHEHEHGSPLTEDCDGWCRGKAQPAPSPSAGTPPADRQAWACHDCGQVNAGWVRICGRCENVGPDSYDTPAQAGTPPVGETALHYVTYGEQSASALTAVCGVECSTWDKPLRYTFDRDKATCPACLAALHAQAGTPPVGETALDALIAKVRALPAADMQGHATLAAVAHTLSCLRAQLTALSAALARFGYEKSDADPVRCVEWLGLDKEKLADCLRMQNERVDKLRARVAALEQEKREHDADVDALDRLREMSALAVFGVPENGRYAQTLADAIREITRLRAALAQAEDVLAARTQELAAEWGRAEQAEQRAVTTRDQRLLALRQHAIEVSSRGERFMAVRWTDVEAVLHS